MLALDDIFVLDLSRVLAGPWCTQILADLGASVVKVEKPGAGDDTRSWGPPFLTRPDGGRGDASYFLSANRGKRSIAVDIAHPEGQALVRQLALKADVVVENYKVGGLKKYGLDQESLRAANPRLVYCSITGFGQTGPYAQRAGYDFIVQGMGGLMSITGERDDLPGGGPQKVGVAVADLATGFYATIAILAALNQRHRTGLGQHVDLALMDAEVALLGNQALYYLVSGQAPGRLGNGHASIVPYNTFPTADGHLIIAVGNDRQFADLARVLGRPEWTADPRFATNRVRVENRVLLVASIEAETRRFPMAELLARLEEGAVPCGPINPIDQVFADPQVRARELERSVPHSGQGRVPTVANPINLSDSPIPYDRGPPLLGEHTAEVLRDLLGLDAAALAGLRSRGVIAEGPG